MSKVTIRDANTGATLEFLDVEDEYFTVSFSGLSLSAVRRVWLYVGDRVQLVNLFLAMAEEWTGWEGAKAWDAMEGNLSLSCTADGLEHITLNAQLNAPYLWFTEFTLQIEAGQLEKIAKEMRALFGKTV